MRRLIHWMLLFCVSSPVIAEDVVIVELRGFRRYDFAHQTILVENDVEVSIEGWGATDRSDNEFLAYGWILESESRRVVWEMDFRNSRRERARYLRKAEDRIRLEEGEYEVYYAVAPRGDWTGSYRDVGDFFDDLFGGFRSDRYRREHDRLGMAISVEERDRNVIRQIDDRSRDHDAIVQIAPMGDEEFEKDGFSLRRTTRVRIYAVGEGDDDEMYDYGWIIDASSRRRVWEMDYRGTDWAGGARKNRFIDEEIELPEGDYIVHFVTDGSHSYERWNRLPPYDPLYWGITLWGVERGFDRDNVVEDFRPETSRRIIADLTRVGNDRFEFEGFTLRRSADVTIRCLGEESSRREYADYGWMIDAETREVIWEMERAETRHAGGARKNRMAEETIRLDAGSYGVYYLTDGSHAYRRWNSGPPYDPEAWGITVWAADSDFDPDWIEPYSEFDDPDILAQIVRVRDHERLRRSFVLEEDGMVRIYAIGEGDDGDMYDYGWIEDERGRTVWEMDYMDTDHAGGARKNRLVNVRIRLDAGEYDVFYRSDGSHSYEDWNDDPPRDPLHWGITVQIESR